jgi:dTDP-4-dehydrorhamnose 3,5-epimerase
MKFSSTPIDGVVLIGLDRKEDERGYFARTFCVDEFAANGLPVSFPQHNVSFNRLKGTLRGMHFQTPPHDEPKVVRCTRGSVFDVVVDLRPGSVTYCKWYGVILDAEIGNAIYIPPGLAHGFQTLCDDAELLYLMGKRYAPAAATGVRFDDPALAIEWPLPVTRISKQDLEFAPFERA